MKQLLLLIVVTSITCARCKSKDTNSTTSTDTQIAAAATEAGFAEGRDYTVFERVRFMDRQNPEHPVEAYSVLLPKGWKADGDVTWRLPGTSCMGTYRELKAVSPDGKNTFQLLQDVNYNWTEDEQLRAMNEQAQSGNSCYKQHQPIEAEAYLREIFAPELGNAEVVSVEANPYAVKELEAKTAAAIRELQSYGAGRVQIRPSAVNAKLRFPDGREGLTTVGVTIVEMEVPNQYTGTSSNIYTTSVSKRTVYTYPAADSALAPKQLSVMLSSLRTNPDWQQAVDEFWKSARQASNEKHKGAMRQMEAFTSAMTRAHEQRMRDIQAFGDNQQRRWEASQASQDRMHTEFIKTIRGVENYRDAEGKFEMTAGYDHVWSREDGSSFIMSNNPSFDPSSIFQDQRWKQMKKVE